MNTQNISIEKLSIKAGALICLCYIIYFLFMHYLKLVYLTELRVLNFFIQLMGIALTLRYYKVAMQKPIKYLEGFWMGSLTGGISILFFSLFIYFFFLINPGILIQLRIDAPIMGQYLTPFSAAVSVMAEGTVSALVLSFALMQYYKDDALHEPFKKRTSIQNNTEE